MSKKKARIPGLPLNLPGRTGAEAPRPGAGVLAAIFIWCLAMVQLVPPVEAQPVAAQTASPASQDITYVAGQLKIRTHNATLSEVLAKVSALTGVKIEIPETAANELMPIVELGPGPARQILASLLSDSKFDYLIQASDTDPAKLRAVVLLPRGVKDAGGAADVAPGSRSPFARALPASTPPEVTQALENSAPTRQDAPAQPENTIAEANAPDPPPQPNQPQTPAQPDAPTFGQPLKTNIPPTFPVAPPASLSQFSMGQQLQQMYQQRMQMVQQGRQAAPANQGNN